MRPLPLLALLATLLAPATLASHQAVGRCEAPNGGLGLVEVTADRPDATFYVDDRNAVTGYGTWVYVESNGIWTSHGAPGVYSDDIAAHNLQRGGASPFIPDDAEICVDEPSHDPDMFIL